MKHNELYYQKLELTTVLEELSQFAQIPLAKEKALLLEPLNDLLKLNQELDATDEALVITMRLGRAHVYISSDYLRIVELAQKGAVLSPMELYETVRLYDTVKGNYRHLASLIKDRIGCKYYQELVNQLSLNETFDKKLRKSVDDTGYVLDEASEELRSIRTKLRQMDGRIKNKLQEIMQKEQDKLSQAIVSLKKDRYCLPVKAEYKNVVKGIVHDVSASGQTYFIEPLAIADLMRQKTDLEKAESDEINRILKSLTLEVDNNSSDLTVSFQTLVTIDFLFAKAELALKYEARRPQINNQHRFNLINARHPLLKVERVIPNNIHFGKDIRGIIITGPNTGGKTVLLKTVGLLVLMVKCGLLIPADPESEIMIYDQVYCDIGDDQSIHTNLSTFSSHLNNIVAILGLVTPNSLVLFDEIGAGTDPIEGSNLALAILKYLLDREISFITTTHYPELKAFAYRHPKVINASMEFNQDTLSPTYRLILGRPGASNAYNIAMRLGLPGEIIEEAKRMTTTQQSEVSVLISKLETEARRLEDNRAALEIEKHNYQKLVSDVKKEQANIEKEKAKILNEAQKEAVKIIENVKKEALAILEEAKKLKNREIKHHEIVQIKQKIGELDQQTESSKPKKINRNPVVGDSVRIVKYDQYGTVLEQLKTNLWLVQVGNAMLQVKTADLEVVDQTPTQTGENTESFKNLGSFTKVASKATVSLTLDLRGLRYEEAKEKLEKYFDDCLFSGTLQFTIIHGYGTGAIRELVQSFLNKNPHVESYRFGGAGEGGMGVTVVTLKK